MPFVMLLCAGLIVYGIQIARSQRIHLTLFPDPVPLTKRTANVIVTLFIVFGVAMLLLCAVEMLPGKA
jgi:uncharacterized membrane protein